MNPPYSKDLLFPFIDKLVKELSRGTVKEAVVLTHNYTDTAWFHLAEELAQVICFTRGRIAFIDSDGNECSPTQGQAFFYLGPDITRFAAEFSKHGIVMVEYDDQRY